jgi:uracil phosphoribosyltransferase
MRTVEHLYGPNVHILNDPYLNSLLTRLCIPATGQPLFNDLIRQMYQGLSKYLVTTTFPTKRANVKTRMATEYPQAILNSEVIDTETSTVVVDIARAGILPSQVCYDLLNGLLTPHLVRQDHLIMARTLDAEERVIGAEISGSKIGGDIQDRVVIFPDPMGATGGSLATAIEAYLDRGLGKPSRIITLNLIITPEFIKRIEAIDYDVEIYAARVDRAMSSSQALALTPGTLWSEESGLSPSSYIIPGGGGFGELMNNSWI